MKIKTKLILGLSMLPILIFVLIGVGWFQLFNLNTMNAYLQQNVDTSFQAEQIQKKIKDQSIRLRNLLIIKEQHILEIERNEMRMTSDTIYKDIEMLESMVTSTEQRSLIAELKITNQKFNAYMEKYVELVSNGSTNEAIALLENEGLPIRDTISEIGMNISNRSEADMKSVLRRSSTDFQQQIFTGSVISIIGILLATGFLLRTVWLIVSRLQRVSKVMNQVANGSADLSTRIEVLSHDEIDDVAHSFNHMTQSLEEQVRKEQEQTWMKNNLAEITAKLSGMQELDAFARTFLSMIVPAVEASQAGFYMKDAHEPQKKAVYSLLSAYAHKERKHLSNSFALGEGLVGQAALENSPILLTDVPSDYTRIHSGLGEAAPLNIYVLPVSFKGEVTAVIEIASFKRFSSVQQSFLEDMIKNLGIILDSIRGRIQLAGLLQESQVLTEELQAQSEELQSQQEELRAMNEELEEQTQALRQSEEKLQVQQEELEQTNYELREKAGILEIQNKKLETTNREVEMARADLEEKARQLTLSSQYKSEFLANMSHELRTPLNSLLILSKLLADNQGRNLTEKQVEFSKTIYSSGCDLLTLINDILDLAKIESGKLTITRSQVVMENLAETIEKSFRPVANEKNIDFNIILGDALPAYIYSDQQRLQQVLKNLLSNAFKFTHQGNVTLEIRSAKEYQHRPMLSFSIRDTGIGIPKDKQELIFQAFQQADGSTNRKYGGTGLGLSICREIAALLGGEIVVESEEGKGSTFTFYIGDYQETAEARDPVLKLDEAAASQELTDIMQDPADSRFLPMEPLLLSQHPEQSHPVKRLLIVDDDLKQRNSLMELIGEKNVILTAVSTGREAMEKLKVSPFDCMLLDLGLSDTTGFDLLEDIKANNLHVNLMIMIYTGRDLSTKEELYLKRFAHTIIIKDSHSPQRLMDELDRYLKLGSDVTSIDDSAAFQPTIHLSGLKGKKVLLVDDDVRNVFALSNALETYGMTVSFAENGIEGLKLLGQRADFDLILMDIMMPEMDGYETIRRIRAMQAFTNLPIIALTAKAMLQDREKCIHAGASDYIAKPVNPDQLISLMSVWLYPEGRL